MLQSAFQTHINVPIIEASHVLFPGVEGFNLASFWKKIRQKYVSRVLNVMYDCC